MKTVLYFRSPSQTNAPAEKLIGTKDFAARARWHLQSPETPLVAEKLGELIRFWKPDGIIVEGGEWSIRVNPRAFARIPTVFLDQLPRHPPENHVAVLHDSLAAGQLAARELLLTGYGHFAFVPFPGSWRWNEERREGFLEALQLNGRSAEVFNVRGTSLDAPTYALALRKFLAALPKPCAVFVANDRPAEKVIAEARGLGLDLPDELAVLGVDDYTPICEHTQPTLSSVKPDFRGGGFLAALALAALMRDGADFRGERLRRYGTLGIVRRASTRIPLVAGDRESAAALELIRTRATAGLRAEEVMKTYSCSRTLAAARFRRATGRSILEEIHAIQLEKAKSLLADSTMPLKVIADFCGFRNPNSLRKFFRRETGKAMSAYRAES